MTPNTQIEATILSTLLSLKEDSSRNAARLDSNAARLDSLANGLEEVNTNMKDAHAKITALQLSKAESVGMFKASRIFAGAIGGIIVLILQNIKAFLFFQH